MNFDSFFKPAPKQDHFKIKATARPVYLYMHPLVNDRTVAMRPEDVEKFLEQHGVIVNWLEL